MIKFIVQIGYSKKYEFESYEKANAFALAALDSQKEDDEIIMKFEKEE